MADERSHGFLARWVEGLLVTAGVGLLGFLIGLNAVHPGLGLVVLPSSDVEWLMSLGLSMLTAGTCAWRLLRGASASDEVDRFIRATGDPDDLDG